MPYFLKIIFWLASVLKRKKLESKKKIPKRQNFNNFNAQNAPKSSPKSLSLSTQTRQIFKAQKKNWSEAKKGTQVKH